MTTPVPSPTDPVAREASELLAKAARGSEQAWRALVDRYGRRVYALVRSRLGGDEIAEEVTQSVFVTVYEQLTAGKYSERGRFESWLFLVALNRVRDEVRRRKRQATPVDDEAFSRVAARAEEVGADPAEMAALRNAVGELSEQDREVVDLRHRAGMAFPQIAETLGQPLGTVLARHHRALKKLKAMIESRTEGKDR